MTLFPADDPVADDPRPTALFQATAAAAQANSWTCVNGWSVARVYTNVAEEYRAAQSKVAIADIGAVIRYAVRGADAAAFLGRATSAPAQALEAGESARGLMLDDDGAVVDIIETARIAPDLYLLASTRRHARRLQLAQRGLDAVVEEISGHIAALTLLGPGAKDAATLAGLDSAPGARAVQSRVRGVEISVRPIAVGAIEGVEVIFPFEEALTVWERLRRAAHPTPIGLDALDVLRIESGAPRPGVDFAPADLAADADKRGPEALGLSHLAPLSSAWFSGRRALKRSAPPSRVLMSLAIDADAAAAGAMVYAGGKEAGRLVSAGFSPRLRRAIAFADVASPAAGATALEVQIQGGARAAASRLETAESRFAAAFRAAEGAATDSRRRRV